MTVAVSLAIVSTFERGRGDQAARLAEMLGLSAEILDKSALEALTWAQEALSFGRA